MLDVAPQELLLVGIVALLVIGPKDLPKAMRFVGHWVGKARGVARQFRSGFDTMVREAELAELEKQWAAENARIMAEHPPEALPAPEANSADYEPEALPDYLSHDPEPVIVEQPAVVPAEAAVPAKPKRVRKPKAKPETAPPEQDDPLL